MIKSFKSRALADLWNKGKSARIDARMHKRLMVRLSRLDVIASLEEFRPSILNNIIDQEASYDPSPREAIP